MDNHLKLHEQNAGPSRALPPPPTARRRRLERHRRGLPRRRPPRQRARCLRSPWTPSSPRVPRPHPRPGPRPPFQRRALDLVARRPRRRRPGRRPFLVHLHEPRVPVPTPDVSPPPCSPPPLSSPPSAPCRRTPPPHRAGARSAVASSCHYPPTAGPSPQCPLGQCRSVQALGALLSARRRSSRTPPLAGCRLPRVRRVDLAAGAGVPRAAQRPLGLEPIRAPAATPASAPPGWPPVPMTGGPYTTGMIKKNNK